MLDPYDIKQNNKKVSDDELSVDCFHLCNAKS